VQKDEILGRLYSKEIACRYVMCVDKADTYGVVR
jgi:hypothetical protein